MDIVNVVATGSFNQKVDFEKLKVLGDKLVQPKGKYPGVYLHLSGCTVTIYKTGRYIFTGVHAPEDIDRLWKELNSTLKGIIDTSLFTPPRITNIVACENLNRNLNLAKIYTTMTGEDVEYEPELFPGFIWKTEFGTANIFSNGKLMLLGCKTRDELDLLWKHVSNTMNKL